MIIEITQLIHCLRVKGTLVSFWWVQFHCGLCGNELADRSAKQGALNSKNSVTLNIPASVKDLSNVLLSACWARVYKDDDKRVFSRKRFDFPLKLINQKLTCCSNYYIRLICSIVFRLKLDAPRTKFCKNVKCVCGGEFSRNHILFNCKNVFQVLPVSFKDSRYSE